MSVEKELQERLEAIFRMYGKPEQATGSLALNISGIIAGGDIKQFTLHFHGTVDFDGARSLCKELRAL